jgi:selenide, water dikinase
MNALDSSRNRIMSSIAASKSEGIPSKSPLHLVLVGGGHAHLQVVKAWRGWNVPPHWHLTLIDIEPAATYSGMVPGCIAGIYEPHETSLDLKSLCTWAGVNFIQDQLFDITLSPPSCQCLLLKSASDTIPFHVLSFDIGSTSLGWKDTPGASSYTIPTRPISKLISRVQDAEKSFVTTSSASSSTSLTDVVVIGGGAAGIELAMSLRGRWTDFGRLRDQGQVQEKSNLAVKLLYSGSELMPDESPSCRRALYQALKQRSIQLIPNHRVYQVTSTHILVDSKSDNVSDKIPYTHAFWATGAESHKDLTERLKQSGMDIDPHGWITVYPTLQSTSHSNIYAAGDCCTIQHSHNPPPPKAGVYAVRAGPVLTTNLLATLQSMDRIANQVNKDDIWKDWKAPYPLENYNPQKDFLKLLACGDGTALGFRFGIPIQGKWVMDLKDHIDQMFMNTFRIEKLQSDQTIDNVNSSKDTTSTIPSQFDSYIDNFENKQMNPELAAKLLQRNDTEVDYKLPWSILRVMANDESYRSEVLQFISQSNS